MPDVEPRDPDDVEALLVACEANLKRRDRTIDLLNEYGRKKFGDEWWPGSASVWIGVDKAWELDDLGYDQGKDFRADHPRDPRVYVEGGRIIEDDRSNGVTIDLTDQARRVVTALAHLGSAERVWRAAQDIGNEFGWFDQPEGE